MENVNEIRSGRQCVSCLHTHLVFVTKMKREILSQEMLDALRGIFADVCKDFDGRLIEFDGEGDYVHILATYPPKTPVSRLVNSLKGVSSRLLQRDFPELRNMLRSQSLWSPSYFAGSCKDAPQDEMNLFLAEQRTPGTKGRKRKKSAGNGAGEAQDYSCNNREKC